MNRRVPKPVEAPLLNRGPLQRSAASTEPVTDVPHIVHEVLRSPGQPLDRATRAYMEPRFGQDFSQVRVHTDAQAAVSAQAVQARAYTSGQQIAFASGQYHPETPTGRDLLAHELTHVMQQARPGTDLARHAEHEAQQVARSVTQGQRVSVLASASAGLQRAVEVRPPGRGEASAFDRRQELVDRMTAVSSGLTFSLDGRQIRYTVKAGGTLSAFDRQMQALIDRAEVLPMRLITRAGRARANNAAPFSPVLIDFFDAGYVDLDDLLASDDQSFQMNLVHLLVERGSVQNYERRIGTNFSQNEFDRAHSRGMDAETELLRDRLGDPTIRFVFEEQRPNGTAVFGFRSNEGYRVFHIFRRAGQELRGGVVVVQTPDGRQHTLEEFLRQRQAPRQPAQGVIEHMEGGRRVPPP